MDSEQATQQIQALIASVEELTRQNEELQKAAESQNGNDSGLLRTRTKKNIEESKETTMRKNQIARSTGGRGRRKKTRLGWRTSSVT